MGDASIPPYGPALGNSFSRNDVSLLVEFSLAYES